MAEDNEEQIQQTAELIKVYNFRMNYCEQYFVAIAFTNRIPILAKIADNYKLFKTFNKFTYILKTTEISPILDRLKNNTNLMSAYFADIDCYGLYTYEEYEELCFEIRLRINRGSIKDRPNIQQIVPENMSQKLVIMCKENDQTLCNNIKECFGTNVIQNGDMYLINVKCVNDIEINGARNKLQCFLDKKKSPTCNSIQTNFIHQNSSGNYRLYDISLTVESLFPVDLGKMLITTEYCESNSCYFSRSSEFCVNKVSINVVLNAKYWIQKNLPSTDEKITDYYKRFLSENDNTITNREFDIILHNLRYERKATPVEYYWTKKPNI